MKEVKSKTTMLIERLKKGWISHFKACYLFKSAHMDRRIREISKRPPEGYKLIEKAKQAKIDKIVTNYKEFMLVNV